MCFSTVPFVGSKYAYYSAASTGKKQETYCEVPVLSKSPAITHTEKKSMQINNGLLVTLTYLVTILLSDQNIHISNCHRAE